jgi:hypothetical protein
MAQAAMRITHQLVELVIDVCADFEKFAPFQTIDSPMPSPLVAMICFETVVHVVVGTLEWTHIKGKRTIAVLIV